MAGTYSQVYIHVVFAVKSRENLINKSWKDELHKYIAGIIKGKQQKPIIVNGMPDHIHAFIGLRPSMSISDLVRKISIKITSLRDFNPFLRENMDSHLCSHNRYRPKISKEIPSRVLGMESLIFFRIESLPLFGEGGGRVISFKFLLFSQG